MYLFQYQYKYTGVKTTREKCRISSQFQYQYKYTVVKTP